VTVLLGSGAGGFGTPTAFAVGAGPSGVAVADFNGDGNADLVTPDNYAPSNTVTVLLGNGAGGFGPATPFPVGANPSAVAVADFNRDGRADLVTTNINTDNVSVLLSTGRAASARPPSSPWAAAPSRWRWPTSTATATPTWSRRTSSATT